MDRLGRSRQSKQSGETHARIGWPRPAPIGHLTVAPPPLVASDETSQSFVPQRCSVAGHRLQAAQPPRPKVTSPRALGCVRHNPVPRCVSCRRPKTPKRLATGLRRLSVTMCCNALNHTPDSFQSRGSARTRYCQWRRSKLALQRKLNRIADREGHSAPRSIHTSKPHPRHSTGRREEPTTRDGSFTQST